MKRIQINHIIVNESILKEIKRHMIAPWQQYMLIITGIIAMIATAFNVVSEQYVMALILGALGIVCFVEIFWLNNKKLKDILKTMKEETDKEENTYSLIFGSDALTIRNCDMSTDNKMPYESMRKMIETQSMYTLFGKKNQFAIIRKDALKIKPEELFEFLKSKDTKIKKWPQ